MDERKVLCVVVLVVGQHVKRHQSKSPLDLSCIFGQYGGRPQDIFVVQARRPEVRIVQTRHGDHMVTHIYISVKSLHCEKLLDRMTDLDALQGSHRHVNASNFCHIGIGFFSTAHVLRVFF